MDIKGSADSYKGNGNLAEDRVSRSSSFVTKLNLFGYWPIYVTD